MSLWAIPLFTLLFGTRSTRLCYVQILLLISVDNELFKRLVCIEDQWIPLISVKLARESTYGPLTIDRPLHLLTNDKGQYCCRSFNLEVCCIFSLWLDILLALTDFFSNRSLFGLAITVISWAKILFHNNGQCDRSWAIKIFIATFWITLKKFNAVMKREWRWSERNSYFSIKLFAWIRMVAAETELIVVYILEKQKPPLFLKKKKKYASQPHLAISGNGTSNKIQGLKHMHCRLEFQTFRNSLCLAYYTTLAGSSFIFS